MLIQLMYTLTVALNSSEWRLPTLQVDHGQPWWTPHWQTQAPMQTILAVSQEYYAAARPVTTPGTMSQSKTSMWDCIWAATLGLHATRTMAISPVHCTPFNYFD